MNCKKFVELISMYIDGEINDIQKKEFEKHLDDCKQCRAEYENVLSVVGLLRDLPHEELPENFRSDLHDKLIKELENQGRKKILFFRSNAFKAISTVAAGILVVFLVKHLFFYDMQIMSKGESDNMAQSQLMEAAEDNKAAGYELAKDETVTKQMNEKKQFSVENEAKAQTAKGMRSLKEESHENENITVYTDAAGKISREVHIIVKADPATEYESIQKAALQNNAVPIASERSELTVKFSEGCADETDKVVGYILDNSDFANFNGYLEQTYDSSNIEYCLDEIQDYQEAFDRANEYLVKIAQAIEKEKNKEVSDPETIKSLEDSQQEYFELIDMYKDRINKTKVLLTIKDKQ